MTPAEPFLRVALLAVDEAGDPVAIRDVLVRAIERAEPLVSLHKPATARRVVEWAAIQMAMNAGDPARAYSWLRQLLAALLGPVGDARPRPPAPEVALAMPPAELLEALAPSPRVIARAIAVAGTSARALAPTALLAEPALARRVLGIRAIPQGSIGAHAGALAAAIAGDQPVLRREAIEICVPAADKARAKVAEALQPYAAARDGAVRAAAIEGIHALRFQLDDDALLAALADPHAGVRAAAARTIGTGRRGYAPAIEERIVAGVSDPEAAVRVAALGAIVRFPSLLGPALVEPLRAAIARGGDEGKTAVFLLGRLGAHPNTATLELRERDPAPAPVTLEGAPRELATHGAYAIGALGGALGVWDRGTGKRLFGVEHAVLLAFVPGRAEVAVLRHEPQPRSRKLAWHFERYRIPSGERIGTIAIAPSLTTGVPVQLAIAADLVTVWCADYRFHIKLGEPDLVIDDAPVLGKPPKPRAPDPRRARR